MSKVSKITKPKSVKPKIELAKKPEPIKSVSSKIVLAEPKISVVEAAVIAPKVGSRKKAWQMIAWGRVSIGLFVLVLLFGGLTLLFRTEGLVIDAIEGGQMSEKQQKLILSKIAKHIELPASAYQIALANDPEKLKALSPFYDRVKSNDIVLVYPDFAVIYDERADVLVNATMLTK